jgi:hypothetical protein
MFTRNTLGHHTNQRSNTSLKTRNGALHFYYGEARARLRNSPSQRWLESWGTNTSATGDQQKKQCAKQSNKHTQHKNRDAAQQLKLAWLVWGLDGYSWSLGRRLGRPVNQPGPMLLADGWPVGDEPAGASSGRAGCAIELDLEMMGPKIY